MPTAIFGGTFDPVHTGHIHMAEHAVEEFGLTSLVVVPNGNPPHKALTPVTDFCHRYAMACLAFEGMDSVTVSDYEKDDKNCRYSLYTMRHFRKEYGEDTAFIIGADSLLTIHLWHRYEELLAENRFIVFKRRGDEALQEAADRYKRDFGARISLASMDYADIASRDIRRAIAMGTLAENLVPEAVMEYISKNRLYGG